MSSVQDTKEMAALINKALPNISIFIRVVLKREKLSEEAESLRARYEAHLATIEQGSTVVSQRPVSIIGDDDSGYFSGNKRVSEAVEQSKSLAGSSHAGYLLRRDDKYRWHRSWCRADSKELKLFIYEDINEEILIRSFSLDGITTKFGPHSVPDCEKENSFAICGIGCAIEPLTVGSSEINENNGLVSPAPPPSSSSGAGDEAYFAAYSESDYRHWKEVLHMLTSSGESSRISLSFLDNAQWLGTHDSTSTSSSSFGSNRESVISNTSSLNRNSAKIEVTEVKPEPGPEESGLRLSVAKQQQPLPSPPHVLPETVPLPEDDDDDNGSECTIYESIDNLVSQFDDAMRATAAAMGQIGQSMKSGGKKRKKKHNLLSRQTSFLTWGAKSTHKPNFLSEKKSELERGDRYSGYLFKKTSSGSWKKRWCTLKGCVFGYYKAAEESHGREYVVLDAEVTRVNDPKRSFAFSLACKGVEEMFLAAEDDHLYEAWIIRLTNAARSEGEYSNAWTSWQSEESLTGSKTGESIYSVPSSLPLDNVLIPRAATTMTPEMAINTGIYSVPKFLLEGGPSSATTPTSGAAGNSISDIYDVPRASVSPDEEGIYDDPYDILDMEIYDYPPDVNDLSQFLEDSGLDTEASARASTITVGSELTDRTSSTISEDSWKTMSLPPIPSGVRPYSMISSDEYPSNRNSMVSMDNNFTLPRNQPSIDLHSIFERSGEVPQSDPATPDYPDSTSLEFGQCIIRGHLHKRERLSWTKLYCIIRNNFLECHKSQGGGYVPALKLFLPGSEVKPGGGDNKHRHALQIKHPRRDGVLVFSTETPEEYPQWVKAFQSGASIQVQAVSNVEEMRISDLELQRRWTTDTKDIKDMDSEGWNGTLPRRKTYSNDGNKEEYATDTLKRRRRFTLGKFGKKKDKKIIASTPELKLPAPILTPMNIVSDRRSVSCEELPGAVESEGIVESHLTTGPDGALKFQGYLSVHRHLANTNFIRYWCVFDGTTINCFINQTDLTLTMSVILPGSQISEASAAESSRLHCFKVWHMETGQCIFFAADNEREFTQWFTVVTQNADQLPTPQQAGAKVVFFVMPGSILKVKSFHVRQRSNSLPASPLDEGPGRDTGSTASINTGQGSSDTPVSTFYRGHLKKASNSHSGKWKERYCVVKDGQLSLYHNQGDKSAITSLDLAGCSIELVSVPRSSAYKLVFKLNLLNSDKTHMFAAPSETEMYAWISALRDSSCESRSQSELVSGGSHSGSPALSGKGTLRKRGSKIKLPEAGLVSYVAASTLTNPVVSGFADVQVSLSDSWGRYWCVLHTDCLYIYQTQQSAATVKTVVLPGYDVHVADPLTYKRQYAILLSHSGVAPVCIAVNDELELNQWLSVLDKAARAEGLNPTTNSKPERRSSKTSMDEKTSGGGKCNSGGNIKKKGPIRADHTINALKDGGSVDSIPSTVKTSEAHQDSIIRRYEKRIRKTHRVANQTEQKLKEHQTALLHFKKELSRHLIKLKELSESGEANAKRRLDDIRKKLAQVDKILPYLSKYVAVNRQAEGQTVAVLKESCTMEIQKMARGATTQPETSTPKDERRRSVRSGGKEAIDTPQEASDQRVVEENPYASLSEVLPEVALIKAKSNYAQLDFGTLPAQGGALRPPSVNYAEVQIGSGGRGVIMNGSLPTHSTFPGYSDANDGDLSHDDTLTPDNAIAVTPPTPRHHLETLQEAVNTPPPSPSHPPPTMAPPPPPTVAPTPPPTVAAPPPPTAAPIPPPTVAAPPPPTESLEMVPPPPSTSELIDLPPTVPPPPTEIGTSHPPPTVPQRSSSLEPPPMNNSTSPTHKTPPKVAKKPAKSDREPTSPSRQDASAVISSAPSVLDRIKALHPNP